MRPLPILIVLLVGVFCVPAAPAGAAEGKLDKKQLKAIKDLAERWFDARPKTYFERWHRPTRQALVKEARAFGAVPEGSLQAIVDVTWKALRKRWPKVKEAIDTPYGKATWIQNGSGGKKNGLVIGMHGGGVGAGNASEASGKWRLPKTMQMFPQGIRLIHDTWNSVHGERFLLSLIEIAKVQYDIDPDRVYAMGFSMGGSGSWFLAGRHPDLLAGAIPAHGVLMAEGGTKIKEVEKVGQMEHGYVPTARNLAVYFYTGREDVNCEPGTFLKAWQMIEGLREDDPEGWSHIRFQCHEGVAHAFPKGEPTNGFKYIREFTRDTFPKTLVWEYVEPIWPPADKEDRGHEVERFEKRWFYWLYCEWPKNRMWVDAKRSRGETENLIDLSVRTAGMAEDFTIYLNPEMIDVNLETVVRVGGKEVWRGKPQPTLEDIFVSLDARMDRRMVFDRKIRLSDDEE